MPSPPRLFVVLGMGGTCCFMCLCVFGVAVCGGCAFLLGRVACVNGIELRGKRCHVTVLVGRDGGCWYGCACLYWWLAEPHVAIFTRTGFRLLPAVLVGACGAWSATRVCGLQAQGRSSKGGAVPAWRKPFTCGAVLPSFDIANTLCENALRGWCLGMGLN